ncbi:uncharacterized protein LOC116182736 [Photinus pyralis]|nr:uncharacterized protein LOC116182736 [Photinus pyralis]
MADECSQTGDNITSIFQGNVWKQMKVHHKDKNMFPLYLYFDDFESCNPLGSKSGIHKIGAVYISLAGVPPLYSSTLDNILLAQLFYSSDRTEFGNKKVFTNLIQELKYLETNGICVSTKSGKYQIYFTLFAILGDNLGLNAILGFNESFNSTYFCRICKMSKDITQCSSSLDMSLIRNPINYEEDASSLSFGIKEPCIWNELCCFHVTVQISCDVMHDLLEGTLRYEMAYIINKLINRKYITLPHLNERIKYFKICEADRGNPIPEIKNEHLKKNYITMSASEMLAFVTYFGMIVGDLIPQDDEVWLFYLLTNEIVNILFSKTISKKTVVYLQTLLEEHHVLYSELFNTTLKPKHHILLHYPSLILNIGLPTNLWTMRFEGYHKILKSIANSITSRKNILLSLSIKNQLRLSYKILAKEGFSANVQYKIINPELSSSIRSIIRNTYENLCLDEAFEVSWVKVYNILYKCGFVLESFIDDENNKTCFCRIDQIFIISPNSSDIVFFASRLHTIGYDTHVQAYEVSDETFGSIILRYSEISNITPYSTHHSSDRTLVKSY